MFGKREEKQARNSGKSLGMPYVGDSPRAPVGDLLILNDRENVVYGNDFGRDPWAREIDRYVRSRYIPLGPPETPSKVFPRHPRNVYVPMRR